MKNWLKGKVQWFDKTTGEGMVLDLKGTPYYVHWSTIVPSKKRTEAKRNLEEGSNVRFKVFGLAQCQQVEIVKEV